MMNSIKNVDFFWSARLRPSRAAVASMETVSTFPMSQSFQTADIPGRGTLSGASTAFLFFAGRDVNGRTRGLSAFPKSLNLCTDRKRPMAGRKHRQKGSSRSWDPVADWYTGWVGPDGSEHHRRLAIPAVIELLGPEAGERVLDIGCGPGVLAPH